MTQRTTGPGLAAASSALRPAAARAIAFLIFWIILSGYDPADLWAAAVAVVAATSASLRLLPPGTARVRPATLLTFVLRFLCQSVVAGVDVARRALGPSLPLHPGFVVYPAGLPPGPSRNMFATLMSLLPGTVPTGAAAGGGLLVHCLDVEQPVAAQLAAEEEHFAQLIGSARSDG
jgi:multicomponent Na+:H+ antiporter subunit E